MGAAAVTDPYSMSSYYSYMPFQSGVFQDGGWPTRDTTSAYGSYGQVTASEYMTGRYIFSGYDYSPA